MRTLETFCVVCDKIVKATAVVESFLGLDGLTIFVNYWQKCSECGTLICQKRDEINSEDLE